MVNLIVVFPKMEDGKNIRSLLVRYGFSVTAVCTTGAQAIQCAESLDGGIVVCGYHFPDMMYSDLHEYLPEPFEMLLVVSQKYWNECSNRQILAVAMPLRIHELVNTLRMMEDGIARRKRKKRAEKKTRSEDEQALIRQAKELLMARNNMTEEEAHRYIQKCSMDSGTNMVETAQMALSIARDSLR